MGCHTLAVLGPIIWGPRLDGPNRIFSSLCLLCHPAHVCGDVIGKVKHRYRMKLLLLFRIHSTTIIAESEPAYMWLYCVIRTYESHVSQSSKQRFGTSPSSSSRARCPPTEGHLGTVSVNLPYPHLSVTTLDASRNCASAYLR